jgi:hypothetical protein
MDITNHSKSTDEIFERIRPQIGVEVDAIIDRLNAKYDVDYINSVGFDLGYDMMAQKVMTLFNKQLIHPILLLQNEAIQELQLSIIQTMAAMIMQNQQQNKEREDVRSLEIWNVVFKNEVGTTVADLNRKDFKDNLRRLTSAVYRTTVKTIREEMDNIHRESGEFNTSIKQGLNRTTQTESMRFNLKLVYELNTVLEEKKAGFNSMVVKTIASRALNSITQYHVKLITREDIARDILDKAQELKDASISGLRTTTGKELEKGTILDNHMLFYKYMGWCNYMMDTAMETEYRARVITNSINDFSVGLLVAKFMPMMNRNIYLRLPSQFDDLPPGSIGDSKSTELKGVNEMSEFEMENKHAIENELRQIQVSGPALGRFDHNYQIPELPEGAGILHAQLLPALERMINLCFRPDIPIN